MEASEVGLACVFGVLCFDYHFAIATIGKYIKSELAPDVRHHVSGSRALRWEEFASGPWFWVAWSVGVLAEALTVVVGVVATRDWRSETGQHDRGGAGST